MRLLVALYIICFLVAVSKCLSTVEQCLGTIPKTKRKLSKMLTLVYGEAGFEVFNAVPANDVRYINMLVKCVQSATEVQPVPITTSRGLLASSNVTDITEYFAPLLSQIVQSLTKGLEYGFEKARSRNRRTTFDGMKMKSVNYLHTDVGNMEVFLDRIAKIRAEEKAASEFFVIPSKEDGERIQKETTMKWDADTDKHMEHFMAVEPSDARYFVIIPLNERSEFSGGEILVRKTPNRDHYTYKGRKTGSQETTAAAAAVAAAAVDEEQEEEEEEQEEVEEQRQVLAQQEERRPKYDKYTRFTPDKGSILILNGAHDVGMRPVTHGERKALVIEYVEDSSSGHTSHKKEL